MNTKQAPVTHAQYYALCDALHCPPDSDVVAHARAVVAARATVNLRVAQLLAACKRALQVIYDLGDSPLTLAARYGPDYVPRTPEELARECERVEAAIAAAEGE